MPSKTRSLIPEHPPTATHQLIKTKEGTYWRAKRGLFTPVTLNSSVQAHADAMRAAAPAARRISIALAPYTADLQKGRLIAAISGRLLRCLRTEGAMRLSALVGLELQPEYPLGRLLNLSYRVESNESEGRLRVRMPKSDVTPVKLRNRLVDGFRITAVVLSGDPAEDAGLHSQVVDTGRLPAIGESGELTLELAVNVDEDFLLALRVECFEEGGPGIHPGTRAMRVIGGKMRDSPGK